MAKTLEIFERVARQEGITIASLEKQIGASKGVLSKAIKNDTDVHSMWLLKLVENYPQYSADWMLKGEEPMKVSKVEEPGQVYKMRTDRLVDQQTIPLYEIEATGGLVQLFNDTKEHKTEEFISVPNMPKCDGAVYVVGDSMYPLIKSGDIVAYKKLSGMDNVFWGEMYLVSIDMDGEEYISVKYVQKSDLGNDYIRLVSQNQHHQAKDIPASKVNAIAMVKATIRFNTMS